MTGKETRIAVQKLLFPNEPREWDGIFGRKTKGRLETLGIFDAGAQWGAEAPPIDRVDERSEKNIATLLPQIQPLARKLVTIAASKGIKAVVTSGTRSYAEQEALYRQATDGRDNDGDGRVDESDERVTKARPGFSWHNHGCAFDLTVFVGSTPKWEGPEYHALGQIGKSLGLEWGGEWSSFKDEPHFEMTNGKTLAQARELKEQGKTVFS